MGKKNLDSVFMQNYTNFRVIYLDDNSQDNTAAVVEQYIYKNKLQDKIIFLKSSIRHRKLHNIYNAFHSCADHEIIVQLDGDDWFAHKDVLQKLNSIFHNPNVWFSYGQYQFYPGKKQGHCREIPHDIKIKAGFRKFNWVTSHVKAFYGWLIKSVKLQDLIAENIKGWEGKFYPAANDCATVFPMLDMAREKINFASDIMYIYNVSNRLCGHKIDGSIQKMSELEIRKLPIYSHLTKPIAEGKFENALADVLILAEHNNSSSIENILLSLQTYLHGLGKIIVLYTSYDYQIIQQFKDIEKKTSLIECFNIENFTNLEFILAKLSNNYIIITKDSLHIKKPIDISRCISNLEKTGAHGLFFSFSLKTFDTHNIVYQHIWNNLYAWKFKSDKSHVLKIFNSDFSLYRKKDIADYLSEQQINSLTCFNKMLHDIKVDEKKVGLFFDKSFLVSK